MRNYKNFTKHLITKFKLNDGIFSLDLKEEDNIYDDWEISYQDFNRIHDNVYFESFRHKKKDREGWKSTELLVDSDKSDEILNEVIQYHKNFLSDEQINEMKSVHKNRNGSYAISDDTNTLAYLVGYYSHNNFYIDIADR